MPTAVAMPKLGFSMEQGTVVRWLKQTGEAVARGEPIVLVESEKVEFEVEAQCSGKLRRILAAEGDVCAPGHLLGVIADEDERVDDFLSAYVAPEATVTGDPDIEKSPVRPSAPVQPAEVPASPRARKLAAEMNVDLSKVGMVVTGKRITEDDVRRFLQEPRVVAATGQTARRIPVTSIRREIAARMTASWHAAPHVALVMPSDFSLAEQLRKQQGVGYQDVVLKAVALELRNHPALNASFRGDHIEVYESINIGFAVALENGLIVPVVREADRKSLEEICTERYKLVEAARSGRLGLDELVGGTFTITSLGSFGVTVFTPVLNSPQCAILGIGAIEQVPVPVDGGVEFRPRVTLTLVFDHRAVDGAPAAAFLKSVRERIERAEFQ